MLFKNNKVEFDAVVGVVGCVFLPLIILAFGLQADLFGDSLSDVGGKFGHYVQFMVISFLYSGYCLWLGCKNVKNTHLCKFLKILLYVFFVGGTAVYLVTVAIPFLPDKYPVLSVVHNVTARVSVGFLLAALSLFIADEFTKDLSAAGALASSFILVVLFVVYLLVIYGTCIIGEWILQSYISFFLFAVYLLNRTKSDKLNG